MIIDLCRTKAKINPYHDRPQASPHKFTMISLTSVTLFSCNDGPYLASTMLGHITLNDHIIIQELFKRSSVGFLLKSTEKHSRSRLQD